MGMVRARSMGVLPPLAPTRPEESPPPQASPPAATPWPAAEGEAAPSEVELLNTARRIVDVRENGGSSSRSEGRMSSSSTPRRGEALLLEHYQHDPAASPLRQQPRLPSTSGGGGRGAGPSSPGRGTPRV